MIKTGKLHLFFACMFAGKTTLILHKLATASRIKKPLYINSIIDTRTETAISTHNPLFDKHITETTNIDFCKVKNLSEIPVDTLSKYSVVGIDEAQFFPDLVSQVKIMVEQLGIIVYVASLSGTFERKIFGTATELIPIADSIEIIHDVPCTTCALHGEISEAIFTHRLSSNTSEIQIGGDAEYICVCRECYIRLNRYKKST